MSETLILYTLGSSGWIPSNGQQTVCFAFVRADEVFIIDAGTGISRFLELKDNLFKQWWGAIRGVHIFLTHYHFDHVTGLFWVPAIFKDLPVTVYAPGRAAYGRTAQETLNTLFRKPYSPHSFMELVPSMRVVDLDPPGLKIDSGGEPLDIGLKMNLGHSDPTISLRFGDSFAFVTDTPPEVQTIDFARGARVLLHESWFDSSGSFVDESDDLVRHAEGPHTGSFGAGLIAKRAGVSRLYLVHHNPERSIEEAASDAAKVSERLGIDCRAALDLMEIRIDPRN